MSKKGFTIVELMIAIMVLAILVGIAVPSWVSSRDKSRNLVCHGNQARFDQAKQLWMLEQGKTAGDAVAFDDLIPIYVKSMPNCPTNGTYGLGDTTTPATCTNHP